MMKKIMMKKNNILHIIIFFMLILLIIGLSLFPSTYGVNIINKSNEKKDMIFHPLPRWREGGTPYNPEQTLHPYMIHLSDAPPSGYIESPPEYEPIHGVLYCYKTGHWNSVVTNLVVALTQDDQYDEIAYVVVSNTYQMNLAIDEFTTNGANMSKVEFIIEPTNAIWIRDYGPHFIWQNNALGIVDSNYFHQRPLDDFIPTLLGDDHFNMPTYDIGLAYAGGNFQPGPNRTGFVTSLINLDNPSTQGFNETFIAELYQIYQGIDELHIMPQLPFSVDGTGHIDMWMNIVDENTVIISEFKPGSDPTAINITENAVPYMQSLGFEVFRTPAWNAEHPDEPWWTHWTYTNSFRVNNRFFIPTYGETYPDYQDEDAEALAAFEAAVGPDVEIVQINCFPIIWAAGAIHCIVMQIPSYIEPEPAVHVIYPKGGELLVSGTTQTIEWVATDTDNKVIPQINLYYSTNGGETYEFVDNTTNTGCYEWFVPDIDTVEAKIKVVAISEDMDQGVAESANVFQVTYAFQTIYDFTINPGENTFGYGYQSGNWNEVDGIRTPVTTDIEELVSGAYDAIANSDATGDDGDTYRYISPNPVGHKSTHIFEFTIQEKPENILDVEILWEGYADACTQIELYIWDYIEQQWSDGEGLFGQNRYMDCWAGNRDGYLKKHLRSNFDRYVDLKGKLTVLLYDEQYSFRSFHDYISVTVTSNEPTNTAFLIGFINNVNTSETMTSFRANAVLSLSFKPIDFNLYTSSEKIFISNNKLGFIGTRFIVGLFKTAVVWN